MVATSLDQAYQLLLSLSCRQLFTLLISYPDMTLKHDEATKLRFLLLLELDYPENLTCRFCALVFLCRQTVSSQYAGPRARYHYITDIRSLSDSYLPVSDWEGIYVRRTVIDLTLRASEYGLSYGLPMSSLNVSGYRRLGACCAYHTYETRFVEGQLILACRMDMEVKSSPAVEDVLIYFYSQGCEHLPVTLGITHKTWLPFRRAVLSMEAGSERSTRFKCPFCEIDLQMQGMNAENVTKIVVSSWRSYGRRHGNRLSVEQIFH